MISAAGVIYDNVIVRNCSNTGTVSGDDDIGGIAGETPEAGGIQDCYNLGTVSATGGESKYGAIAGYVYGDDYDDEHYGGKIKNCYYLNGTAEKGIGANDNTSESEVVAPTAYDAADFANGTVLNLLIANRTGDENPWDTEGCGKYYSDEAATKEITKDATISRLTQSRPTRNRPAPKQAIVNQQLPVRKQMARARKPAIQTSFPYGWSCCSSVAVRHLAQ